MAVNVECRKELLPLLPCRIPSADTSISIRFNPEDMQIFIRNFGDLLDLIREMTCLSFHRRVFGLGNICMKSYTGGNITTLMVNAKHIWDTNYNGGLEDDLWRAFFKHIFPHLKSLVVGYIDDADIYCRFPDHPESDDEDEDEAIYSDSEDCIGTQEWKRDGRISASAEMVRNDKLCNIVSPDDLAEIMGDFLAKVMDDIETEDPNNFEKAKRPTFYCHSGVNLSDSRVLDREINLEVLEIGDSADRFNFGYWGERWTLRSH
ncbi:hypothetical protein IFR05_002754 [Cadophora sp. M221]|nr:hypothetical protein IFR05_002754 [Cadophora sp. M221]